MKVKEFEDRVFELEGVRLIVRADSNEQVGEYVFERAADKSSTLATWWSKRVTPLLNGRDFVVLDGQANHAHGGRKLGNVRASYRQLA